MYVFGRRRKISLPCVTGKLPASSHLRIRETMTPSYITFSPVANVCILFPPRVFQAGDAKLSYSWYFSDWHGRVFSSFSVIQMLGLCLCFKK